MSPELFETLKQELETSKNTGSLAPSDLVSFSEPLRGALNQAMRAGQVTLTELADMLHLPREQALEIARILKGKGFLQQRLNFDSDETIYEVRMSARTRKFDDTLPRKLWDKLDDL